MKAFYAFITKANQVLFFVAVLTAIAIASILIYSDTHRSYTPAQVTVAKADTGSKTAEVKDVRLLGKIADIYIFGIVKKEISAPTVSSGTTVELAKRSDRRESDGEIVNVVFSKSDGPIRPLLSNEGLILRHYIAGQFRTEKAHFHTFLCVTEDSDGNHILNQNDRNDLYIVPETLSTPDIVVQNVSDFDVVSENELVAQTRENGSIKFWAINVTTASKKEVQWRQ